MAKILIAEDDLGTRLLLKKTIEGMGHIPLLSPNGRHAWETLQVDRDIDLLITDVMMPEMDGIELVELIRKSSNPLKDLPIAMVSSVIGPRDVANLLDHGATEFMPKPVDALDLKYFVDRYLNKVIEPV